jgi:GT2 family glycosyltransferase
VSGHPGSAEGETGSRSSPVVSIVVCFFNLVDTTSRCLDRVRDNSPGGLYEVILVDDGSDDPRVETLAGRPGVTYIRSDENLGFTHAANLGARRANGTYLVFLNNDTEVESGWLEALIDAAEDGPDVGAVGAMQVSPEGRIREAGVAVWSDATGMGYGSGHDPAAPQYRFRREVDYCSGSCLLVKRRLFAELGGFDEYFAPGYYEDPDLCFALRRAGHVVLYEPGARVVHLEGATFGTDASPEAIGAHGRDSFELNRVKFRAKWAEELLHHYPPGTAAGLRGGRVPDRPRVLLADGKLFPPGESSGGLRTAWLLLLLHELGCEVTVFPLDQVDRQPYADWLRRAGIEVYCGGVELSAMAGTRPGLYDLVILSRPSVSIAVRSAVRFHFPSALLVYDTVDLHFLREERRLAVESSRLDDPLAVHEARRRKRAELDEIRAADVVGVVTGTELDFLRSHVPRVDAVVLPNVHAARSGEIPGPQERADLVFVGGYEHPPNVDAVAWFVDAVLPLVRAVDPIRFKALGSFPPARVRALESEVVSVPGHVADLVGFFDRAKVFVAPLRYGAGMKGKIGTAMSLGLPVVTTSVGAEGMGLLHEVHALIADDPEGFADAVLRLYHDDALWERLSVEAARLAAREWAPAVMRDRLRDLVRRAAAGAALEPRTWGRRDPGAPLAGLPGLQTEGGARRIRGPTAPRYARG